MISNINQGFINRVYDFDDYTINELLCKFYQKIQEVITECNEAFSIVNWIKEEGLEQEVVDQLQIWLEDGTMSNLLNEEKYNILRQEILDDLAAYKTTIDNNIGDFRVEVNTQVLSLTNTLNTTMDNYKTEINGKIATLTNSQNEFESDVNNSIAAMQTKLNTISYVSTYSELVNAVNNSHTSGQTIYVKSGTYTLTDILFLGNNTKLIGVGDVTFKSSALNVMVSNYCNNATGYNGTQNIEVNNITFDANNREDGFTLIGFGHANNIKITNCRFKNLHQWHMIELNGCQHGIIEQCEFDNYGTSGSRGTEVIQLDLAKDNSTFPWFGNYDNTNCNNITIRNCKFTNIGSGCACVGNHSYSANYPVTNVTIQNCYANGIGDFCRLRDFTNLVLDNNKVSNAKNFYTGYSVETVCRGLKIINNDFSGLFRGSVDGVNDERFLGVNISGLGSNSLHFQNVRIINNRISNCRGHAIGACIDDCIISNNSFADILWHGIYYHGGNDWLIQNNLFSQTGMENDYRYSIYVNSGGYSIHKGVISGNIVYNRKGINLVQGTNEISHLLVSNNIAAVENNIENSSSKSISVTNNI